MRKAEGEQLVENHICSSGVSPASKSHFGTIIKARTTWDMTPYTFRMWYQTIHDESYENSPKQFPSILRIIIIINMIIIVIVFSGY